MRISLKTIQFALLGVLGLTAVDCASRAQFFHPSRAADRYHSRELIATSRLTTLTRLPDGLRAKTDPHGQEAIREIFGQTVAAALEGRLPDVVARLSAPVRTRLTPQAGQPSPEYQAASRRFAGLWMARYHQPFSAGPAGAVFAPNFVAISTGEIVDPAVLEDWPLDPTIDAPVEDSPTERAEDAVIQVPWKQGSEVAMAVFPASGAFPEVTLSLVRESPNGWKIDVPQPLTLTELQECLTRHLDELSANTRQWPSDANEARRMVSRLVLLSLYGQ